MVDRAELERHRRGGQPSRADQAMRALETHLVREQDD